MKIIRTDYTFDASAQTITFTKPIVLERLVLITNVTDNVIIYNFADANKGGSISVFTLTLTFDTTSMSDTDELQIFYEDGVYYDGDSASNPVGSVIAYYNNGSGNVEVASTSQRLPVDPGSVTIDNGSSNLAVESGGNLDAIAGDASTISSNTGLVAGAIAGTEMQVDIVAPLPAGTNDIGDVTINNAGGVNAVNIQDGGNVITVDGTVTVNAGTNLNTSALALESGGNLAAAATSLALLDNAISGNEMQVDVVASLPAGTNNIGDVDIIGGGVADDATTPGNPIMIGGTAVQTDGTDPGSVSAEDDVARLRTDMNRRLLVNDVHPRLFRASADYASAQTNTSIQSAPGAGLSLYITDITISNGATAGNITLLDGSGGTVVYEVYPAINGGAVANLRTPIRLTANTALCITSTTVTTHAVNVSGYIAP